MQGFVFYARLLLVTMAFVSATTVLISSILVYSSQQKQCHLFDKLPTLHVVSPNESTVGLAAMGSPTNRTDLDVPRLTERISHSTDPPQLAGKRRSLFIMGHDRSGTTFISNMLAQDPQVFMVYEPLWITRNMRIYEPGEHLDTCELDVVSAILSCSFAKSPAARQFLIHTDRDWTGALPVNVFKSRHFCNFSGPGNRRCPGRSPKADLVDKVCSTEYKHSVVKVSPIRVPRGELSVFVPQILVENPDHDIRIVHIVRDPRGSMHSRINLKWMHDYPDRRLAGDAIDTCKTILANLKHAARMKAWLGERYTVLRYKDIAEAPVETARRLYEFAGFDMPDKLPRWIVKMTQPSRKMILKTSNKPYSPVRNSTGNAERWRKESPAGRVRVIERSCGPLLDYLGLERTTNATMKDTPNPKARLFLPI